MNKNFKVVFSKARGALMVVNELTSSVQAKGTKTVIAATVASLVAGGAIAKEIPYENRLPAIPATPRRRPRIFRWSSRLTMC